MIVAHPDDESLWGGDALANDKGWNVVCLTNGGDRARAKAFHAAMDLFGVEREMLAFPDRGAAPYSPEEIKALTVKISGIVNPDTGQAKRADSRIRSGAPPPLGASAISTTAMPSASFSACSRLSARRGSMPALTAIRSTTTSMSCLSFLSSAGASSSV
ncbi:MAG: hypothetical protein EBZ50_04045 [Alphaproteobacteria bacterium]|nr:hypothetical protein [Alphaproteobacteria bacterium]